MAAFDPKADMPQDMLGLRNGGRLSGDLMRTTLLAIASLSLAACATATRMHTACDVPRFTWSNLVEAPSNSSELMTIGDAGAPEPSESHAWFTDTQGRLLFCRVDPRNACVTRRKWIFVPKDGQWTVTPDSGRGEVGDTCGCGPEGCNFDSWATPDGGQAT